MRYGLFLFLLLVSPSFALDQMLADITEPVESSFATYVPIPVNVEPSVEPWEIEPDLSNVVNADDFDLTQTERDLIAANSFVVIPIPGHAEVYDLYNVNRDRRIPSFVSSDAFLHAYHILFDHLLKRAELTRLFGAAQSLNETLVSAAVATVVEASGQVELSAAHRLLAFHSVAACLLDSTHLPHPDVADLVNDELALIRAHDQMTLSPIFGLDEDYTQYKVRGHYSTSDTLACYFGALMWYGRMTFALDEGCDPELVRDHTLSALFLVRDMARHPACHTQWTTIYWPTVFFVGRSDDLTPLMYQELAESVYGSPMAELSTSELADSTLLDRFIQEARAQFELPQIADDEFVQGLRFMGQRFIPDSYVFEQLVVPHCERTMPRGLDIMASLGSDRAMWLLDNVYGEFSDPLYVAQLQAMCEYMESISDSTWAGNLYYNWLYSLMPLLFDKTDGWPVFMTNSAWSDRELSTSLMSWGELRHDTILYAKQSYTSGMPPTSALLQGYVEPNPYLWARLAALADYTKAGLSGLGLLGASDEARLDMLRSLCMELLDISIAELEGIPLSPAQDSLVAAIGLDLQVIISVDEPSLEPGEPDWEADDQTAVIADVHTDLIYRNCLEEGVGYPWELLVAVRRNGVIYLTRGVFLPYYEFTLPMSQRMTDEEWRELLTGATPSSPPVWTASFRDSTVSLLNPSPAHFFHETKSIPSFSFILSPEVVDTGMTVTVDVFWDPHWYGGVPQPSLTVTSPSGERIDVFLDLMGENLYQGSFSTGGWTEGDAVLWFDCEDPDGNTLLDWGTTITMGSAQSPPAIVPTELKIIGIKPHPVRDVCTISFSLPSKGRVRLSLFDMAGRERAVLYQGQLASGLFAIHWQAQENVSIPTGAYILHLASGTHHASRPLVLSR